MTIWTADTHVHFYPHYDPVKFFNAALNNLNGEVKILYLTERARESFYNELKVLEIEGFQINSKDTVIVVTRIVDKEKLFIIPGFQIITESKLEILSLASNIRIADGLSEEETISLINNEGAIAVIPWSPGKWIGKRGEIIKRLLNTSSVRSGEILNSALHFNWSKNALFGSDPLPLKDEEKYIGTLGVTGDGSDDVTLQSSRDFLKGNLCKYGSFISFSDAFLRTLKMNI